MSRLRSSGMGASPTFNNPREIPLYKPLHIRYALYVRRDQPPR